MSSVQAGTRAGTRDAPWREDPSSRHTGPASPGRERFEEGRIEIDDDDLPSSGSEAAAMEMDEEYEDEEPETTRSVYAMSTYPGVQAAFQVEYPYRNGLDSATMCVTRWPSCGPLRI